MGFGMVDRTQQTGTPFIVRWIQDKLNNINQQYPVCISQDDVLNLAAVKWEIFSCADMLEQIKHEIDSELYSDIKRMIYRTDGFMKAAIMGRIIRGSHVYDDVGYDMKHLRRRTPLLKKLSRDYRSKMKKLRDRFHDERCLAEKYDAVFSMNVFPESW
jgi:hypothetical protein